MSNRDGRVSRGLLCFGACLGLIVAALVAPGQAAPGEPDPAIVFTRENSWDPNRVDMLVMDADGSNVEVIKYYTKASDFGWGPDGTKIAYEGGSHPDKGLYVINVDGSGDQEIYSSVSGINGVSWSPVPAPDGEHRIAFWEITDPAGLYVIKPDGTGLRQLLSSSDSGAPSYMYDLAWSPDATRLAARVAYSGVAGKPPQAAEIFDLGLDGSGDLILTGSTSITKVTGSPLKPIGGNAQSLGLLDWSNDGDKVLLCGVGNLEGSPDKTTWYVDLDDLANPVQVTDIDFFWDLSACWSPDDAHVTMLRREWYGIGYAGAHREIVTMDPDGTGVSVLYTGVLFSMSCRDGSAPPPPPPNQSPTAVLSASPLAGEMPFTVDFDASASSDPDGAIDRYEWDFDGDGSYEYDSGTNALVQYDYVMAGTFEATVRVTDAGGATATDSVTVAVTAPPGGGGDPETIALDGFESGSFSGGSGDWMAAWSKSGDVRIRTNKDGPYAGNRHVRLRRGTGYLERRVDLAGASNVVLRFAAKVRSFESSDKAYVKVSADGSTWTTVHTFTSADSDNAYHTYEVDLSGFAMTGDFRVAFDAAMSGRRDYLYLDDIELFGVPGG